MNVIRIVLPVLLIAIFGNCSGGKKNGLLLPFLALLNNPGTSTASGSTGSTAGNTGSSGVVFVSGDGSGNPSTSTSVSSSSGSGSASGNSNSAGSSSGTASSSGNSGSSGNSNTSGNSDSSGSSSSSGNSNSDGNSNVSGNSNGSNQSGNSDHSGNTAGNSSSSGSSSSGNSNSGGNQDGNGGSGTPTSAVVVVDDPKGNPQFNFNTTQSIPMNITILDKGSKPVAGASVLIYDDQNNLLFQGVADSSGKLTGTLTAPTSVGSITIDVTIGGQSISQYVQLDKVLGITRTIRYQTDLPDKKVADSDGDGVADDTDIYPNDKDRCTELSYPSEGVYTLAFEDLYPSAGDADLNDYVVQLKNQEDLNAAGKIVRLRGRYQHVARGAGYRHKLMLKLPVRVGATVTYRREDGNGKEKVTKNSTKVTADQLNAGIELLPDSSSTLDGQNANPGEVFKPGHVATVEIVFDTPVSRASLGSFPYDTFAHVISTNKDIHFPGLYKNGDGSDSYLDSSGFPWAILVPGSWKYPYEKQDIRNPSQTGYSEFSQWVASRGGDHKLWYQHISNEAKVFPVSDSSDFLGYLLLSVRKFAVLYAAGLLGIGGIALYFLRKKQVRIA